MEKDISAGHSCADADVDFADTAVLDGYDIRVEGVDAFKDNELARLAEELFTGAFAGGIFEVIAGDLDLVSAGNSLYLLIEELFMLIREKNDGKAVLCECIVLLLPDGVQIITKDEGVLFDISEADVSVTSIAALAVSDYMEKLGKDRKHLTTMSFNRSSFLIKTQAD